MPAVPGRRSPGQPAPEHGPGTRLETDDEIRQALEARRAALTVAGAATSGQTAARPPHAELETKAERPVGRPPVGMVCIVDDGQADGEWVRLRADRTTIGRIEGDIRIPHDALISGRHAEIVRRPIRTGFGWLLLDLQSTNGTFVRIGSSPLFDQNEFLIGTGRYRFEAPIAPDLPPRGAGTQDSGTRAWSGGPVASVVPSLVEITPAGSSQRVLLTLPEYWIGREAGCAVARPDDVYVNARHARLCRDSKGQWHIENNKSLNGVWLRVTEQIPLSSHCRFRLGEQRFIFQVK